MKWKEFRKIYPDSFLKMPVLQGRIEDNARLWMKFMLSMLLMITKGVQ